MFHIGQCRAAVLTCGETHEVSSDVPHLEPGVFPRCKAGMGEPERVWKLASDGQPGLRGRSGESWRLSCWRTEHAGEEWVPICSGPTSASATSAPGWPRPASAVVLGGHYSSLGLLACVEGSSQLRVSHVGPDAGPHHTPWASC